MLYIGFFLSLTQGGKKIGGDIICPNCRKSINVYPTKIKNQYVCLKCVYVFEPKKQFKISL